MSLIKVYLNAIEVLKTRIVLLADDSSIPYHEKTDAIEGARRELIGYQAIVCNLVAKQMGDKAA